MQSRRADDVHANLAGGVAAEHGAVLDKNHLGPEARRRERAAHARHAATGDEQVAGEGLFRDDAHRGCVI